MYYDAVNVEKNIDFQLANWKYLFLRNEEKFNSQTTAKFFEPLFSHSSIREFSQYFTLSPFFFFSERKTFLSTF